ncbi:MAG: hypothetical protein JEZ07_07170 [Phycisphaerae bacterium]|nr:hypothetical protein [Phycisphaerae bacterium]
MPEKKMEGTFYIDGLIEGPIFDSADQQALDALVNQARGQGITLHLSTDGGRFSFLADRKPVKLQNQNIPAHSVISRLLDDWLVNYSPQQCDALMSTLRSAEYLPGKERQTIYGILPEGRISTQQRTVDADTVPQPIPMDRKSIIKASCFAFVIILAIIGISSFFVPYKQLAQQFISNIKPYDTEELSVDCSRYQSIFNVEKKELDKKNNVIKVSFKITKQYPFTKAQLENAWKAPDLSLDQKLALESLARKCLISEFYDKDGKYIGKNDSRIFAEPDQVDIVYILLPYNRDIKSVQLL